MLPIRCIQLPCRNMEVTRVISAGIQDNCGGRVRSSNTTAGMVPRAKTAS